MSHKRQLIAQLLKPIHLMVAVFALFTTVTLNAQEMTKAEFLQLVNNPKKAVETDLKALPDIPLRQFGPAEKEFAATALTPTANIFYVAPNGLASGNGSITNPWNLATALNHPAAVLPGDTIYLRGGVYNVPATTLGFRSFLRGTESNPIKVMSYPGEWAVIDGNVSFSAIKQTVILRIDGGYTWFANFEITNSETATRKIDVSGSNPPERRGNSIDDAGLATKLINLVIHDTGQGIASANDFSGNEYYGNVVYNNGWDAPDRLHGHGNYIQNGSGTKMLEDNFWFNQFEANSQVYGSSSAAARNLTWIGNVFFNGGMAWWGPNISNLTASENMTFNHLFKVGNGMSTSNTTANIQHNYLMAGAFLDEFGENITFKYNTVWYNANEPLLRMQMKNAFYAPSRYSIDQNIYYKGGINQPQGQFRIDWYGGKKKVKIVNRLLYSFSFDKVSGSQQASYAYTKKSWKDDLRFDIGSTWIDTAPTGLKVFLRPNKYQAGRANLIIYNWSRANTVTIDVSSILSSGDTYELRSVQDYFGDVVVGTYNGAPLSIDMVNRTLAKPVGYDQITTWYHNPLRPTTFPTFGAFVLIKTNS